VVQNKGYYCSKDCYFKDVDPKFQSVSKNCKFCGKKFPSTPTSQRPEGGNYCSYECYYKDRTNRFSGENCPAWRGGISFEPYCPKFNNEFRERVRTYYDYKCILCGKTQEHNGRKLSVHHVNYKKEACCDEDIPRYFVTLCVSCHAKTNNNREKYQKQFEKIIHTEVINEIKPEKIKEMNIKMKTLINNELSKKKFKPKQFKINVTNT